MIVFQEKTARAAIEASRESSTRPPQKFAARNLSVARHANVI
jgi:hypothetical protein